MPDLLVLLTTHARGNAFVVPIVPQPPTPAPPHLCATEATEKKRKRGKLTRNESFEEGEIPLTTQKPPSKEP